MATKRMKSLKLPGLSDTYTFVQADSTLSVSGEAADAKATGDALKAKAGEADTVVKADSVSLAALAVAVDDLQRRVAALEDA